MVLPRNILTLLGLSLPACALAASLSANQPLSAWHHADHDAKAQLIDAVARQLQASAGIKGEVKLDEPAIIQCVDRNHTPDTLTIHGQKISVTVDLAVMLCVKLHTPALSAARFQIPRATPR